MATLNLDEQLKNVKVYNEMPSARAAGGEGFRVYGGVAFTSGPMGGQTHGSPSKRDSSPLGTPIGLAAIVGRDSSGDQIYTADPSSLVLNNAGEIWATDCNKTPLQRHSITGFLDYNSIKPQLSFAAKNT